ncbi:MAG: ABC transporter permease [Anaerolineae bacterium]
MSLSADSNLVYDSAATRRGWKFRVRNAISYRFLLYNLVIRDLKARYKNSVLGILWSMLNPLGLMLVFTVLFTVLRGDNAQRQFPVFVLVGLVPWNFFSGTIMSGTGSVVVNSPLVKKVYFPRALLPASSVLSNLVNFLITFLVLVGFLYAFGLGLTVHALWVPVILLTQLIFMLGLTLLLSAITVLYRDVMLMLEVVMLAWFFMTPVFYPFEFFGESSTLWGITFNPAQVMRWVNPMASIIDGYRTVLWGTQGSAGPVGMNPAFILRTFVTAVIILIIGYTVFSRLEHLFGEKL